MDGQSQALPMPNFTEIKVIVDGTVGHLVLARPERGNALNPTMVREIGNALDTLTTQNVDLIALSGEGKHFCTGFDLSDLAQCSDGDLLQRFVEIEMLLHMVYQSPVTTLAAGKGRVIGAGADLFVACDRRVTAGGTTFSFPGAGFGLVLGTKRLSQRIGRDHARRIVTQGETVNAENAVAVGLATELSEGPELERLIASIGVRAGALGRVSVAGLHDATAGGNGDAQLAALVRSAARPGLKTRIEAYRARVAAAKPTSKA